MVKGVFTILSLLLAATSVMGQDVEFSAAVNRNVASTDDRIVYEISTNQDGNIDYPDFDGFKIIAGPSTRSSRNISIINGKMTSEFKISHTIYLKPVKTGKLTIGSAQMTLNGKQYKTNPIEITVSKGSNPVTSQGGSTGGNFKSNDKVIARAYVNRSTAYVGQPIVVTYKIYSQHEFYQLIQFEKPTHSGFSRNEIDMNLKNNTYNVERETINGKRYNVITLARELLIPQEYGDLKLSPYDIQVAVLSGGFFRRAMRVKATSNAPSLEIKPLPAPQPEDFSGAVGQFTVNAELSKKELKVNEGLDLKLTIKGNGNLKYMEEPKIDFPSDFEVEIPETEDKVGISAGGMSGSIIYNYFIIPRIDGEFELEDIGVTYFDPETGNYERASAGDFELSVKKGDGTQDAVTYSGAGDHKKDVALKKEGIKYIETGNISLREKGTGILGTALWWSGIAAPGLAFLLLLLIKKRRERIDPEEAKEKAAGRIVRKHLTTAKKMLESGDTEGYYEECQRALYEYLKDKFHMDMSDISHDQTRTRLLENNIAEETTDLFGETVEKCEMARYAPMTPSDDREIYDNCVKVIRNIEKQMR